MATPAKATIEVVKSLGNTSGKVIIDAMNIIIKQGPDGFNNTADAILAHTQTQGVVKCFNTTGFNNMENTNYGDISIDLFVAGDCSNSNIKTPRQNNFQTLLLFRLI